MPGGPASSPEERAQMIEASECYYLVVVEGAACPAVLREAVVAMGANVIGGGVRRVKGPDALLGVLALSQPQPGAPSPRGRRAQP